MSVTFALLVRLIDEKSRKTHSIPSDKEVNALDFQQIYETFFPLVYGFLLKQCGNAHLAEQKLSAWLLLQQVLERCLSADLNNVEFCKHPSGKWTCNLCHFSISHSQNVVCVAISNNAVGVDMENLAHFSNKSPVRLLERISTQSEQSVEPTLQNVAELWSKKEAIFKAQGCGSFVPNSICTLQTPTHTFNFQLQGQQHVVSLCGSTPQFFVV